MPVVATNQPTIVKASVVPVIEPDPIISNIPLAVPAPEAVTPVTPTINTPPAFVPPVSNVACAMQSPTPSLTVPAPVIALTPALQEAKEKFGIGFMRKLGRDRKHYCLKFPDKATAFEIFKNGWRKLKYQEIEAKFQELGYLPRKDIADNLAILVAAGL